MAQADLGSRREGLSAGCGHSVGTCCEPQRGFHHLHVSQHVTEGTGGGKAVTPATPQFWYSQLVHYGLDFRLVGDMSPDKGKREKV